MMRTLVVGWFSFNEMGASAGDLMACELACEWLKVAGRPYDVAWAPPFTGGVDWTKVDPHTYSDVIFVCGPFGNGWPITDFLPRFAGSRLIGLDLTMLEPLTTWNPFALLWERDSSRTTRPDISFFADRPLVPVAGLVLIDTQPEYGTNDAHQRANDALRRLAASRGVAAVSIDTRLDTNTTGLHSAAEVESLIARMDLVLTTRLHGTVLALKNGVPALAVDSVVGGGKITRQAEVVGWPCLLQVGSFTDAELEQAFDYCLSTAARVKARECADRARAIVAQVRDEFIAAMTAPQT
jgi:hypothetical protein